MNTAHVAPALRALAGIMTLLALGFGASAVSEMEIYGVETDSNGGGKA